SAIATTVLPPPAARIFHISADRLAWQSRQWEVDASLGQIDRALERLERCRAPRPLSSTWAGAPDVGDDRYAGASSSPASDRRETFDHVEASLDRSRDAVRKRAARRRRATDVPEMVDTNPSRPGILAACLGLVRWTVISIA